MDIFSKKGTSLIEFLVYITVLTTLLLMIMAVVFGVLRSYDRLIVSRHLSSSGSIALERMVREIRSASSVNQAQSTLSANPGHLVLIAGATTTDFSVSNGALVVKQNSILEGPLTTASTTVTNLIFRLITTPFSSAVKIEMTLQAQSGSITQSAKYFDTVVLRNSY